MAALFLFFVIVALLFGFGFAVTALFYVAIAFFVIWVLGLLLHGSGRRWYYW